MGGPLRPQRTWVLRHGILGGLVAATVYGAFEAQVSWALFGRWDAYLRMIAALVLVRAPSQVDATRAILIGGLATVLCAVALALGCAWLMASQPRMRQSQVVTVLVATVVGFVAWLVGFYGVAPLAQGAWLVALTNPTINGFLAHTFAYGSILGIYLADKLGELDGGSPCPPSKIATVTGPSEVSG